MQTVLGLYSSVGSGCQFAQATTWASSYRRGVYLSRLPSSTEEAWHDEVKVFVPRPSVHTPIEFR